MTSTVKHFGEFVDLANAEEYYRKLLEVTPQAPALLNGLAEVILAQGRGNEACELYFSLHSHGSKSNSSLSNLALALRMEGRWQEARVVLSEIVTRTVEEILPRLHLASVCPEVVKEQAEIRSLRMEMTSELSICSTLFCRLAARDIVEIGCLPPYNFCFHAENENDWRMDFAKLLAPLFPHDKLCRSNGKLRVGIVVSPGNMNNFSRLLLEPIRRLGNDEFELTILGTASTVQGIARFQVDGLPMLQTIPDDFFAAADALRTFQADVLYFWKASSNPWEYFLPFMRLAPIQCVSSGQPATTGIPEMDYFISSALTEPADGDSHYSEKLVRLTSLPFLPNAIPEVADDVLPERFGFANDAHLYVCLQALPKFHPDFDPLVANILRADENGLVVILECGPIAVRQLLERMQRTIPDVIDRVRILPSLNGNDYFELIKASHVLLDTIHYTGVATTYDSFQCHRPVITLPGRFYRGRYTSACYRVMGYEDCIARNEDNYVDLAVRLGTDADYRHEVRREIANRVELLRTDDPVKAHADFFRTACAAARNMP